MEHNSLFSNGKQEEDPMPPNNQYGFLKFPMDYAVEIASPELKVRGDVRRCSASLTSVLRE
ncbi:UNVERIFIED_CONTAM: Photosynthetic NDH subunit of subcomplex B 1, chloroplastic [Sesamum radiatum]|uniref:Photosynthetic NDH subunit of subcomplex B 1, chloroplastic n=1 Tax=Sesamum radiatum TaxID=300843 RepID=A0AAW2M2E4_SESRA